MVNKNILGEAAFSKVLDLPASIAADPPALPPPSPPTLATLLTPPPTQEDVSF